ncbi:MAG: diguanylate cyclase [Gallionellaceae bacterium]
MFAKWWNSLSIQIKLSLLIQVSLVVILAFAQRWVMSSFENKIIDSAKVRAIETADGIINGMNMLMITGQIGDAGVRALFIEKMGKSQGIKELRIFRSDLVKKQFGDGLPQEQAKDEIDRSVLHSGKTYFARRDARTHTLRAVIPFIASHDFKGTDCLECHHVPVGSVVGAANVVLDITDEAQMIDSINQWLWLGQFILQLVLFFVIDSLLRSFTRPVQELQAVMSAMQADGDLSRRVEIPGHANDEIGQMANAFNALADSLQRSVEMVKQGQDKLKLSAQVFINSAEAIVISDLDNNIIQVNKAFTDITGYSAEEVIGQNPRILKSGQQGPDFYQEMWRVLLTNGSWQGEIMDRRKNGDVYPKWLSIAVVRGEQGEITNYIALFTDITERKASFDRIQQLAHFDALTLLPNRTLLNDHIDLAISGAKRNQSLLAILFLDLDRFKNVNDTMGHHVGDLLLQAVAVRLQKCVRESDTVSRLGGDEFVILLGNIHGENDAAFVAQKIINSLDEPIMIGEYRAEIGTSIGISIYPTDGVEKNTLLKHADAAMYMAKDKGRNNFQFFHQIDAAK